MKKNIIGAEHEFHDESFAQGWTDRFKPTLERISLFELILSEILPSVPADSLIVELGIGPGYLANHILSKMPFVKYIGIDFSQPMIDIANNRLKPYLDRLELVYADLVHDNWEVTLNRHVNSVISTWALHDLGSQENIFTVYSKVRKTLSKGGILLNGDFIKPEESHHEYEGGRLKIDRHIEMLEQIGFSKSKCIARFEEEINNPTPTQNYACIKAVK